MILLTGGLGFIGSHMAALLIEKGEDFVIVDNLSNARVDVLSALEKMAGRQLLFVKADIRDPIAINDIFCQYPISSVIHFAGLKSVNESIKKPIFYYDVNVAGTISLVQIMQQHQVFDMVFSSSAAIYGTPEQLPIVESSPKKPNTPYGETKWMCEQFLASVVQSDSRWRVVNLRYFNPIGAHPSGLIGENPLGVPMNLMPYLAQVVAKQRECLSVFGGDYPTPDGTCIRDYLHVMDLVKGHWSALKYLLCQPQGLNLALNLGRGCGISILEFISAFEKTTGQRVPFQIVERRQGDTAMLYASAKQAEQLLNWRTQLDMTEMCRSSWYFIQHSGQAKS